MSAPLLLILFSALNLAASEPPAVHADAAWHLKRSPHFEIYYEADWAPDSISLELERLYGKLRLNISMFAPWMLKEKTKVYIYKDQDSYLRGDFNPPAWSKGLAYFALRTVVIFDPGDMVKLRATAAHELSHLYFESYYGEHFKYPPQWLNEGLAVLVEDMSYSGEGPWSQALKYFPKEAAAPLKDFFKLGVGQLSSDEQIGYWYLEAFGVVSYLFTPRTRLQFRNFCAFLREGGKLEPALWKFYRLNGPAGMEAPWREWLRLYAGRDARGFSVEYPSSSFNFKPVKFSPVTLR
ncbi:MAG: hypothetical protein WCW52_04285 [Elusimicrobiales bacterium]|jgi:hypothetical protein